MEAKILMLDIENTPITAYCWGLWKQNIGINQIVEDWSILSYAAKWIGEDNVYWDSTQKQDEGALLSSLWGLLDEADIVVAHNGDRFDMTKINAKMLEWDMPPYSPVRTVDTLKVARKRFRLTSNKLDYISKYLGFEGKMETGGMKLWIDCMAGKKAAWKTMIDYNIADVIELEHIYLKLLPWIDNHPNVGIHEKLDRPACPKCTSTNIQFRGYAITNVSKFRRFQCNSCGGWGRMPVNEMDKELKHNLTRSI